MQSQVKECLKPPQDERNKKGFSPRAFGETKAPPKPCFQNFGPQICERTTFCCFKPPKKLIRHLPPPIDTGRVRLEVMHQKEAPPNRRRTFLTGAS